MFKEDSELALADIQIWEENCDQGRTNANFKTMNTYRGRDNQKPSGVNPQLVKDDAGVSQSFSAKKKKRASDPRFKRIIITDVKNDSEGEVSKKKFLMSNENEDSQKEKIVSLLKPPKDMFLYERASARRFGDRGENTHQDLTEMVTKDPGLQASDTQYDGEIKHSRKHQSDYKNSSKIKKRTKTSLKRSASDCTLHMKNLYGDETEDDIQKVRPYPSGTQLPSSINLRKECRPDKRRSVITVIGQTQTKPFSEVLEEINQRRKLAKELDKHALCEAIMESNESQPEVKNLVAKVDFVLPDGKVIYSTEKVYLCKEKHKDCGEILAKSRETFEDQFRKLRDIIPERESSISQVGKKSRTKRTFKMATKENTQLKEKRTCLNAKFLWALLLIVFFSAFLYGCMHSMKPSQTYYSLYGLFAPQTMPWYEKLLL